MVEQAEKVEGDRGEATDNQEGGSSEEAAEEEAVCAGEDVRGSMRTKWGAGGGGGNSDGTE